MGPYVGDILGDSRCFWRKFNSKELEEGVCVDIIYMFSCGRG